MDPELYHALTDAALRERLPPFWASLAARPSQCVPDGTVVVTAVNARHRELLEIQAASIPPCFLRRYGALCFDVAESTNVSCAHWPTAALGRRLSYDVFTWLKWDLLHLALVAHGVGAALWLDCDVAILRNPFAALHPHPAASASDLSHQRNSVSSDLNTGVMLVRSEPLVRHVLAASRWWEGRQRDLEQVVVQRLLAASAFTTTGMTYATFASFCWLKVREGANLSGYAASLLCRPSTLHANCLSAAADKRAAMRGAVAAFRARCGTPRFSRLAPPERPKVKPAVWGA